MNSISAPPALHYHDALASDGVERAYANVLRRFRSGFGGNILVTMLRLALGLLARY